MVWKQRREVELIIIERIGLTEEGGSMNKKTTQMIKGIAILIMIMHHFIVIPFSELSYLITLFGYACKICVAIYAVLSGYGYFFAREKTVRYGLKKIWGLLQIYWISLFTLFIPAAIMGGWKMTPYQMIVQMFGLLPNLNWFAWYVFFYVFCMMVMPILCKYRVFRYKPIVNLGLMLIVPYCIEIALQTVLNYETNTIIHDLFSCFLYFPCFLIGYWMAENQVVEKSKHIKWMRNPIGCVIGIAVVFAVRILVRSVADFLLDVFYAPILICAAANLFEELECVPIWAMLNTLGKYSTGIWFFHAVFFSTYVCDWFQPILKLVSWPSLMFVWLVVLSLAGAFVYQKILDGFHTLACLIKRSF